MLTGRWATWHRHAAPHRLVHPLSQGGHTMGGLHRQLCCGAQVGGAQVAGGSWGWGFGSGWLGHAALWRVSPGFNRLFVWLRRYKRHT